MTIILENPTQRLIKEATCLFPSAYHYGGDLAFDCRNMTHDPYTDRYEIVFYSSHITARFHFYGAECSRVIVKKGGL